MTNLMVQFNTGKKVELVFACAWCPKQDYVPLRVDQQYTHGVCKQHLIMLQSELKTKREESNYTYIS